MQGHCERRISIQMNGDAGNQLLRLIIQRSRFSEKDDTADGLPAPRTEELIDIVENQTEMLLNQYQSRSDRQIAEYAPLVSGRRAYVSKHPLRVETQLQCSVAVIERRSGPITAQLVLGNQEPAGGGHNRIVQGRLVAPPGLAFSYGGSYLRELLPQQVPSGTAPRNDLGENINRSHGKPHLTGTHLPPS